MTMNRPPRSLMQTFLLAACALTLILTGFDLTAQAQDNGRDGRTIQSAHATLQQTRRRARRRASPRRRTRPNREFVDTTMMKPPTIGVVQGTTENVPLSSGTPTVGPVTNDTATTVPPPRRPAPPVRRPTAPISGGVLNGKAISLPKPPYPAIARAARAGGTVVVQVIVSEEGDVISARAVSGHPLLQQAAVQAAYGARFSPTHLSGQPVKVTGTISYNFVP
jgi:TonB family protein